MSTEERESRWLQRLVGEWTYEMDAAAGPDHPAAKLTGSERVRSLGTWVVCEGEGDMPDGGTSSSIMSLGYDPAKGRFTGTFIASMMTHLWVYEGELDAGGTTLTLDTEGPGFEDETTMVKYRDVIRLEDDDHRVMTSAWLAADGSWREFMTSRYRRVR